MIRALSLLLCFFWFGCTSKNPEPIQFGHESCDHCRMIISDPKFGGEIVLKTGKKVKFDSLTCLAAYESQHKDETEQVYTLDFNHPGEFIIVDQAFFLKSELIRGPMGVNVLGVDRESGAQDLEKKTPGKIIRWEEVQKHLTSH